MVPARLYGHNRLINASMGIDQRCGPYTLNGTTSTPVSQYTLDQWYVYSQCAVTVSQVTYNVGNSFYLQIQRTSGQGLIKVGQTISMFDCRGTYSQILSAQLRAFCGASFAANGGVTLNIYAGTGTSDVNNVNPASPFAGQALILSQNFTPSTTNTLITAVAKALTGATVTQLSFELSWTPLSATPGTADTFSFSQCQLETSSNPTPFERISFAHQLIDCLYYYRKSYPLKVVPGTTKVNNGVVLYPSAYAVGLLASGVQNGWYVGSVETDPMYTTPTVTIFSYNGVKGRLSQAVTGTDLGAGSGVANTISEKGFAVMNASGGQIYAANGGFWHHYTLEAVI
jgi:hypothetical protein